jgi:hypothetical protein
MDGGNLLIDGYIYQDSAGHEWPLPVSQIVHFKSFNPFNEFVGSSKLESLTLVGRGDIAQQGWNLNLFGKDNAKLPGALAFRDMVPPTDWENLKRDIKSQWGGTNRSGPMLLRGTGAGGVEWVTMAATPVEMEFIASRNFTKEEIYGVLAPGAASILAVNATEANAKTGKQTLIDLAIWPSMVSISQKITNDLLPAYGPNLKAEFDDIRVTDRVLELSEQAEYAKTHTVAEVRQKYYNDKPVGDDRDGLFPAQVQPSAPPVPPMPAQPGVIPAQNPFGLTKGGPGSGRYPAGSGGGDTALSNTFHYNSTDEVLSGRVAWGITPENKVVQSTYDTENESQVSHTTLAHRAGLTDEGDLKVRGYFTHFKDENGEIQPVAIVYTQSKWGQDAEQRVNFFMRHTDSIIEKTGVEKPKKIYVSADGGYSGESIEQWNPDDLPLFLRERKKGILAEISLQSNLLTALNKWQVKAEKRYKDRGCADCDFADEAIPGGLAGAIQGALAAVKSMDGIKRIFADAKQWQGYP